MGQLKFKAVIFSRLLKCMSEPESHQRLQFQSHTFSIPLTFLAPYLSPRKVSGLLESPQTISLLSRWWASPGQPSGLGLSGLPSLDTFCAHPQAPCAWLSFSQVTGKFKVTEQTADNEAVLLSHISLA